MAKRQDMNLLDYKVPDKSIGQNYMLAAGLNCAVESYDERTMVEMLYSPWTKKKARRQIVKGRAEAKAYYQKNKKHAVLANTFVLPAQLLWSQDVEEE